MRVVALRLSSVNILHIALCNWKPHDVILVKSRPTNSMSTVARVGVCVDHCAYLKFCDPMLSRSVKA